MTLPAATPPPSPPSRDLVATAQAHPGWCTALALGSAAAIGTADMLLPPAWSLLVFYFIPISLAILARGRGFGMVMAGVSVVLWLLGDVDSGAAQAAPSIVLWKAVIALVIYLVLGHLFASLLAARTDLEERIRQRTAALEAEMEARGSLERAVLEISEREHRSLGHELHDGLGQHLTGTALTGQLLVEKLQEQDRPEAADARRVVDLVQAAIEQSRQMAKGLLLAEVDAEGLSAALAEFCAETARQHRVRCAFEASGSGHAGPLTDGVATHLFRIAQEAVRNAVRHGRAKAITVRLSLEAARLVLEVEDNGAGLPPPEARGAGLGLGIMAHRAQIVGGRFALSSPAGGGTVVTCSLP